MSRSAVASLHVQGVHRFFGGVHAVDDVTLSAHAGRVLGIIGQNGAGKTTLFNTIAGTFPPSRGRILVGDEDVTDLPAWQRARRGIGRTFQIPQPIRSLSVIENVQVGLIAHGFSKVASAERARHHLTELGLGALLQADVASLSPGQMRLLEFARAAALEPRVLLLDEVFAGLSEAEQAATSDIVRRLRATGIAIVWIEHHVRLMMALADEIAVMDQGAVIAHGAPHEVARDERVIDVYLGSQRRQAA